MNLATIAAVLVGSIVAQPAIGTERQHLAVHIAEGDVSPQEADVVRRACNQALSSPGLARCPSCKVDWWLFAIASDAWGTADGRILRSDLDSLLALKIEDATTRALGMALAAQGLARRRSSLEEARRFAAAAQELGSAADPFDRNGAGFLATCAQVQFSMGHGDSAVALWQRVLSERRYVDDWDRQRVLVRLAEALELGGRFRQALDQYVLAAGMPFGGDSTARSGIRLLARESGLDADSILQVVEDARGSALCKARDEYFATGKIAAYTMRDLQARRHDQTDLEGAYSVIEIRDFGCPFCRRNVRQWFALQRMLERDRIKTMEFGLVSGLHGLEEERNDVAMAAGTDSGTVVCIDHDGLLWHAMGEETTPIVYICNAERRVRFKLVGSAWLRRTVIAELLAELRRKNGTVYRHCD